MKFWYICIFILVKITVGEEREGEKKGGRDEV